MRLAGFFTQEPKFNLSRTITVLLICLFLINRSAHSQNGFVVTGTFSSKPYKYFWLPNDVLVAANLVFDTAGSQVASGNEFKYVGDDIFQVQLINNSWGYDAEFPYKVNLLNSRKENVLKREFILYYFGKLSNGMIPMGQSGQKFGFINVKGDTIIPFKYEGARSFSNGRAAVAVATQDWTLIDEKGNDLLKPSSVRGYRIGTVTEFEKGFSIVTAAWAPQKFSVASDRSLKPLLPYEGLKPEIISKYIVMRGNSVYLYNEALDTVSELGIKNISKLGYDHFSAENNGVAGIYNPDGRLAFLKKPDYQIQRFNGKVYSAYNNVSKTYCLLDTSGKEIFSCSQFKFPVSNMKGLSNGISSITSDGITGLIDEKGKLIVPLQFTDIEELAFSVSKYMLAVYNDTCVILRLKTPDEMKKEQQLIAQKKMPTAEQCFTKAKDLERAKNTSVSSSTSSSIISSVKSESQMTMEAALAFVTSANRAKEEIDKLTEAFNACTDGSGKGANGRVSDAALRNASAARSAFFSAMDNYKSAKTSLENVKYEIMKPYFSNFMDYVNLYKSVDKAKGALTDIMFEEQRLRSLIDRVKISNINATYYDVWLNLVREAATRHKEHMLVFAKEFHAARIAFGNNFDIALKSMQTKRN